MEKKEPLLSVGSQSRDEGEMGIGVGTCAVPLAGVPTHEGNSCSSLGIEEGKPVHTEMPGRGTGITILYCP